MSLKDCKIGPAAAVSDMKRAQEFYEGTLGLEPDMDTDEMKSYPCGDGTGFMVYVSPEHAGSNTATLAGFEVPDFDGLFAELKERGVSFERYDREDLQTDDEGILDAGDMKVAFFKDPDGNTFSING